MVKLYYQNFGAKYLLKIEADNEEELLGQYYSFINHSECKFDLFDQDIVNGKYVGYLWIDPNVLILSLERAELFKILNKLDNGYNRYKDKNKQITEISDSFLIKAKIEAKKQFNQMVQIKAVKNHKDLINFKVMDREEIYG